MKNQWKKIKSSLMLTALTLVATGAVSAQQWAPQNSVVEANMGDMPGYVTSANDSLVQRSHTISLNANGAIDGRIASMDATTKNTAGLSGLSIYFVRDGQVAYQAQTTTGGSFTVANVAPGPYSFVATGQTGFAAYGVYVTANTGQNQVNLMEAAAVSPQFSGINQIVAKSLPTQVADQIMQAAELNTAQPSTVAGANRVRLVNGQLNGQVVSLFGQGERVRGTTVYLIQNGQRIAEVQVDEQGAYTVPDLQPGVYDFVAAGSNGLAAIRFEAVGQDSPMTQVGYTRTPRLVPTSLDVCLTCQQDNSFVDQSVDYAVGNQTYAQPSYESYPVEYAGSSIGNGAASGGSCGCSGNFAGYSNGGGFSGGGFRGARGGLRGSGMGRLLLLGGAAGGIIAISDPDNNSPNN
jgi:hypothetical protein